MDPAPDLPPIVVEDPPFMPGVIQCLPDSGTGGISNVAIQQFAGALPADITSFIALPMPKGANLIGSDEYLANQQTVLIDVDLSVASPPAAILAFYRQALPPLGFTPPPTAAASATSGAAGAASKAGVATGAFYCSGGGGPWLALWAAGGAKTPGAVPTSRVWIVIHSTSNQAGGVTDPCSVSTAAPDGSASPATTPANSPDSAAQSPGD